MKTHHTVVGKDLDIIYWAAQVLRDLPPDASYCLITVSLQDTHKHTEAHTEAHTEQLLSLQNYLYTTLGKDLQYL